ncbi:NUDIX domain-containing protein [Acidobacteriota bacterium]
MSFKNCPICGESLNLKILEDRERKICLKCEWVHYENPIPCTAAFVRNPEGGILLVKRGVEPGYGLWGLPSGFIEIDETPEMGCLRELEEETGLQGKIVRLVGVYSQESSLYKNVIIIGYEVDVFGKLQPGSDSLEARYFFPQELPKIAFSSHSQMLVDGMRKAKK